MDIEVLNAMTETAKWFINMVELHKQAGKFMESTCDQLVIVPVSNY